MANLTKCIKQTIPFDTISVAEECKCTQYRVRETLEVKINGFVADRISLLLLPSAKTARYMGVELPIMGEGFNRYLKFGK
jgi:hypothetical protein